MLPGNSELVLTHIAQARVLARLHLLYEPARKLRLWRAEITRGNKRRERKWDEKTMPQFSRTHIDTEMRHGLCWKLKTTHSALFFYLHADNKRNKASNPHGAMAPNWQHAHFTRAMQYMELTSFYSSSLPLLMKTKNHTDNLVRVQGSKKKRDDVSSYLCISQLKCYSLQGCWSSSSEALGQHLY